MLYKDKRYPLKGKKAIVTGGSRGIGFALAQEFVDQGVSIVICSRSKKELQKALKILNSKDELAYGVVCDVSKLKDCKKLIQFAKRKLKNIDILVNNAGIIGEIGEFESNNLQKWVKAIKVNLFGTVYCTQLVIPYMKRLSEGKIINFAGGGIGGKNSMPNFSSYICSKIAVIGFSETVAKELAKWNIQINSISPGAVNTKMTDDLITKGPKKAGEDMYKKALDQKNHDENSPKSAIEMILFLCSPNANNISGRLISAKWDNIDYLKKLNNEDMFKLRRIDNDLFGNIKK